MISVKNVTRAAVVAAVVLLAVGGLALLGRRGRSWRHGPELLALMVLTGALTLAVVSPNGIAAIVGPPVVDRQNVDFAFQITYIDPDSASPIAGRITNWFLWAKGTGDLKLQAFREVPGGYELIGENAFTITSPGYTSVPVPTAQQIDVQAGDILGFRYGYDAWGTRIVAYDYQDPHTWTWTYPWPNPALDVPVGGIIPTADFHTSEGRIYSLAAEVLPEPGTLALLALGWLAVMARRKRRK